jgi:phage terminase large subunit-like protein
MIKNNTFLNLIALKHGGKDKTTRSRSIQARMRAHGVKFAKDADWYPTFENECLTFPRGKHDDQVDAFAYLGMMLDKLIEAPTKEETDELEYADELRSSQSDYAGRSSVTGY